MGIFISGKNSCNFMVFHYISQTYTSRTYKFLPARLSSGTDQLYSGVEAAAHVYSKSTELFYLTLVTLTLVTKGRGCLCVGGTDGYLVLNAFIY